MWQKVCHQAVVVLTPVQTFVYEMAEKQEKSVNRTGWQKWRLLTHEIWQNETFYIEKSADTN